MSPLNSPTFLLSSHSNSLRLYCQCWVQPIDERKRRSKCKTYAGCSLDRFETRSHSSSCPAAPRTQVKNPIHNSAAHILVVCSALLSRDFELQGRNVITRRTHNPFIHPVFPLHIHVYSARAHKGAPHSRPSFFSFFLLFLY
jgi:hypothetical protein